MRVMLFANSAWYLFNFRLSLANALRDAGYEVILVSPDGSHGQSLRERGFHWISAPMKRRSLNPIREAMLLLWLRRLMVVERIELVHSFTIKCAVLGSLAARTIGRGSKIARINSITGMGFAFTSGRALAKILRPLVRALMRLALGGRRARVILQNPDDARLIQSERLAEAPFVRVIRGSGVDCARFILGPSAGEPSATNRLRVLFPARLLWDKGIAEFVDAARRLIGEGRRIQFLVAGTTDSGNPTSVPETTVQQWRREGVVELLGHVDDMPGLLGSVDVVALPSHREGLPKSLIEAGACGRAIVTTDVPGCREVVDDEVDGLLVPPHDPAALTRAIARLADDPVLRERLGKAARAKVLAEFDERIVIERTKAVYAELFSEQIRPDQR